MEIASKEDVAGWFDIEVQLLDGAEILFAEYEQGGYEGSAFVLIRRNNKLYEVNGSHCSCYGLEGQWDEEETSVEALEKRMKDGYGFYSIDTSGLAVVLEGLKE